MKLTYFAMLTLAFGLTGCTNERSTTQAERETEAREHEADNTGRNARDAEGKKLTPFDQSNDQSDVELQAEVRKAITDDKDLSVKAHNVKVFAENGVVTLRGPVDSAAEKTSVEDKAKHVPGVARVNSELETVVR